jgi:hypothetical protein
MRNIADSVELMSASISFNSVRRRSASASRSASREASRDRVARDWRKPCSSVERRFSSGISSSRQ